MQKYEATINWRLGLFFEQMIILRTHKKDRLDLHIQNIFNQI